MEPFNILWPLLGTAGTERGRPLANLHPFVLIPRGKKPEVLERVEFRKPGLARYPIVGDHLHLKNHSCTLCLPAPGRRNETDTL